MSNFSNECNIAYLSEETICDELKTFIKPFVERERDLSEKLRRREKEGRKWWTAINPDLTKEAGFESLSDIAKKQYYNHCERMYIIDTLDSEGYPVDPSLWIQSIKE